MAKIDFTKQIEPANVPSTGNSYLYIDTADGQLTSKDADGTIRKYITNLDIPLSWLDSAKASIDFTTAEPASPTVGYRYINTVTGTSSVTAISVTVNYVYEWSGSAWTPTVPVDGDAIIVTDPDPNEAYVFSGAAWVNFGAVTDHNNLAGLQGGTTNEYYHLNSTDESALTDANAQLAALHTDGTPTFGVTTLGDSSQLATSAAPTSDADIANKKYVDDQVETSDTLAEVLANGNQTGGTDIVVDTGDAITLTDSPTADTDGANKKYVDDAVSVEDLWDRSGTTLSPKTAGDDITTTGDVTGLNIDATNKTDVDLNTVHRSSDGKDHSDVVLNNTHRVSDGSDHTFIDQDVKESASPTFVEVTTELSSTSSLADGVVAVTQSPLDNSTKPATTKYVDDAVSVEDLWDRSGTTLNPTTAGDDIETTGDIASTNLEVSENLINAGITWTDRTLPEDNDWRNVVYGNGLFVAISSSGVGNRVMTSPDGINWTTRTTPTGNAWTSITYGNGLFVAVSNSGAGNRVMTSPDGVNWVIRTSAADNSWISITYGNGLFVAVAATGTDLVMTSPDGITWTSRTSASETNKWRSVIYGNGLFVAVADDGTDRVMTSPDGISWTIRTGIVNNRWFALACGNGLFVSVAFDGTDRVMTSSDGITWNTITSSVASNGQWLNITYGDGLFVAVGNDNNRVMTSPDGINWTARNVVTGSWYGIAYGNGVFVSTTSFVAPYKVMTSGKQEINVTPHNNILQGDLEVRNDLTAQTFLGDLNGTINTATTGVTQLPLDNSNKPATTEYVDIGNAGITWTSILNPVSNEWQIVTYGNGLFVAVAFTGTNNRVMTSPDGINWTTRTTPTGNAWTSITYGNGLFVAVSNTGTNDRVMTSPDGINWTIRTSAANVFWRTVTYGNGLFVAVANDGAILTDRIMTSPDGIVWTSISAPEDNDWRSITYGNGLFVVVASSGTGNRVMTSSDGIVWTIRTNPVDNNWQSVIYGNGLFVAIARNAVSDGVMTSPDGIVWTSRTIPDLSWRSVTYGNGLFVAVSNTGVSNDRIITSPDGITWTTRTSVKDNRWLSIVYGNGLFVAVSDDDTEGEINQVMISGKQNINITPHNNILQGDLEIRNNLTVGEDFISQTIDTQTIITANIVYVNSTNIADTLPGYGTGTITLAANTTYYGKFEGDNLVVSDVITWADNAKLQNIQMTMVTTAAAANVIPVSANLFLDRCRITYVGDGIFIQGADMGGTTNISSSTIILANATGSTLFDLTSVTDPNAVILIGPAIFTGIGTNAINLGTLSGMLVDIQDIFLQFFDVGLTFSDNKIAVNLSSITSISRNVGATHFSFTGTTQDQIQISGFTPNLQTNDNAFYFDPATTYNRAVTAIGCAITTSGGTPFQTGSYDNTTVGFKFVGNTNIPDSTANAYINALNQSSVQTLLDINQVQRITATFAEQGIERFSTTASGSIESLGNEDLVASVFATISGTVSTGTNIPINFYFAKGSSINTITAFADAGGGLVTVTTSAEHELITGDRIIIEDTADYDYSYTITVLTPTTFNITAPWVATETGSFYEVLSYSKGSNTFTSTSTSNTTVMSQVSLITNDILFIAVENTGNNGEWETEDIQSLYIK